MPLCPRETSKIHMKNTRPDLIRVVCNRSSTGVAWAGQGSIEGPVRMNLPQGQLTVAPVSVSGIAEGDIMVWARICLCTAQSPDPRWRRPR